MAIQKKLLHFKQFSDFNSKKLSANEANTQYTVGVGGEIQSGSPDILYQSIVWIKDTKQQWTHGQLYSGEDFGERPFVNEAEFSFRATAGKQNSVKDGLATIESIYGNSIVWNQMVDYSKASANAAVITKSGNTITATLNADSLSATYGGINFILNDSLIADHYYYIHIDDVSYSTSISNLTIGNMVGGNILTADGVLTKSFVIKARGTSAPKNIFINAIGNLVSGATFTITGLNCVDLTKMYGAGNEPTTLEDFQARMPIVADMNSYNEGAVLHMDVDAIKSVGDNAWDEEWENGGLDAENGSLYDTTAHFRNKGYIRVIPNTQYYFKKPIGIVTYLFFYDEDKNFVKWLDPFATAGEGGVFTTYNAPYMRFTCYMPTYNHDIMLTLVHSGWKQDTDAGYQPYWEDVLVLDKRIREAFPDGMKSAGQASDMAYNKNGKAIVTKRISSIDLGSLTWGIDSNGFAYSQTTIPAAVDSTGMSRNVICASFGIKQDAYWTPSTENVIMIAEQGKLFITGDILSGITVNELEAQLKGVILFYESNAPTTYEVGEPFNLDYRVADFGTEEAISSQSSASFKAKIKYNFNANDTIRTNALAISNLTESKQDKLVSGTNIKTINGQSLLGSGDISISGGGGSSSGSGAYAEVNHGTSDTTFALTPNTFHVWDEVASLTLDFGSETSGVANEFLFQFTSGATATSLTLPDDIKWTEELVIEANMIYQVSILKGLASVLSWENGSNLFPVTLVVGEQNQINADVYNYLYNTYGEVLNTTYIGEELSFDRDGVIVAVATIIYGTYEGYTGYWLNGYVATSIKVVLLSDGSLVQRFPIMPEEN